jgi:hypothetical protein
MLTKPELNYINSYVDSKVKGKAIPERGREDP